MIIFDFDDYKKFVSFWQQSQPKKGHGLATKMADHVGVSAATISQIFNGEKDLSPEHAYALAEFIGLVGDETDYFLLLVSHQRAGSHKLRAHLRAQIKAIQKTKLQTLKEFVKEDIALSESDKATFYSSWLYSAIRLMTSIDGYQTVDALALRFRIPREEIARKLAFLIEKGLCVAGPDGYRMGPQRTHLESTSPYIKPRQISWRVKGFEKMESVDPASLFYTGPMSISEDVYNEIRRSLVGVIASIGEKAVKEKPTKLCCLNIDLFDV